MRIENISADVRIVKYDNPFGIAYDVRVEVLKDGQWITHWECNSLSNDFAYSDATAVAHVAAAVLRIA